MTRSQRVVLGVLAAVALGLRLGYLLHAVNTPGYVWEDPDRYAVQARRLASPRGWRWSFGAVTYTINNQRHALPPLYSVFLSVFLLFPGFPMSVLLAQSVLSAGATLLVFALARRLHSIRAGLLAAAAYAVWTPNILGVWSTSQETLYIPLLLSAFVLMLRAMDRDAPPVMFGVAGLMFAAAALTRSMPLFFIVPAAALQVWFAANRRRAALQAAALLGGFLIVIAPYSIGLSRHFGQLTIVDTHGSIHLEAPAGQRAPGIARTASQLWQKFSSQPREFVQGSLYRARSLLHVNGGRQLQIYIVAPDRLAAVAWKTFVHLGTDALLIVGSIFAAFGVVVCRQPALVAMCVLWTLINIGIASVGGFSGARLRTPFEPFLMIMAAVFFAGGWRRSRPAARALAGAVAAVVAFAVLPQISASLRAWPDYGIRWPSIFDRTAGQAAGSAGINVPAYEGLASIRVMLPDGSPPRTLHVRAGGVHVRSVELVPGQSMPVRALWPRRGLAFIELEQSPANEASLLRIEVEGR